jgi:hypothetical protein
VKGFKGNIEWVHNEEGSGARFYKSSVYFPDDRKNPKSNSGVTIDPGVDLGNASRSLINDVLNYYRDIGSLDAYQFQLLFTAIGLKKHKAINWIIKHEPYFKKIFLVPPKVASIVMHKITADDYWMPLIKEMPELEFLNDHHAKAVHTALLSLSYNRGPYFTADFAKTFIRQNLLGDLGNAIKKIPAAVDSLRLRREREGNLILSALKLDKRFEPQIDITISPMPMTPIPYILQEKFIYEVKKVN